MQINKMTTEDKKWKAEEDLRTLRRAEEIQNDIERMKECMKIAAEEKKSIERILASMPVSKMKQKTMKDYG